MLRVIRCRSLAAEILDGPGVPEPVRERCYRDLARTHRWLGNHAAIVRRIRRDPLPVSRVLDIGCGHGALLEEIRARLGVEVVGVDLRPPARAAVPILQCDAIRDRLPAADIAVCLAVAHHLTAGELAQLIGNVGRSCRRFLLVDLVRHPAPAALFRAFVAPLVHPINVQDGIRSLERAFTRMELSGIVSGALAGSGARFRHQVAPLCVRQIVDIDYRGCRNGLKT